MRARPWVPNAVDNRHARVAVFFSTATFFILQFFTFSFPPHLFFFNNPPPPPLQQIFLLLQIIMPPLTADSAPRPSLSTPHLTNGFDMILHGLIAEPSSSGEWASTSSRFHASKIPKISLSQYFQRIVRYCPAPNTTLIVALIYLYRLVAKCGQSFINSHTVHRQLMVSVVVASKFCDDFFETNSFYARVGGISIHELNALEIEFLARLNFDLTVDQSEYLAYENFVHVASSLNMGPKTGPHFEPSLQQKVETIVSSTCSTPLTQIVDLFGPCTPISSS